MLSRTCRFALYPLVYKIPSTDGVELSSKSHCAASREESED